MPCWKLTRGRPLTLMKMMIDDEPVIRCQRCQGDGGSSYRGWQILCSKCVAVEEEDWWEDEGTSVW
jgi:hypothetical protein